jgi:hypothetical protein
MRAKCGTCFVAREPIVASIAFHILQTAILMVGAVQMAFFANRGVLQTSTLAALVTVGQPAAGAQTLAFGKRNAGFGGKDGIEQRPSRLKCETWHRL